MSSLFFCYGKTRWVILIGKYAIKIARFRPIRPLIRLIEIIYLKEGIKDNLKKHDKKMERSIIKYFGAGILANRIEWRVYKKYGKDGGEGFLAPTLASFFCGLVNVQERGYKLDKKDVDIHSLTKLFKGHPLANEFTDERQLCLIDGRVYIVDYGRKEIEMILKSRQSKKKR